MTTETLSTSELKELAFLESQMQAGYFEEVDFTKVFLDFAEETSHV